jgi:DNA-directed RNA polymerase subunit beta'
MLQDAVDVLFDNSRNTKKTVGAKKKSLKSLAEILKGKEGRFRHNLLGKRVDYSGRSVIVSGPELHLHQCGIPKKMALEIFKPFIYHALLHKGFTTTIKGAKSLVDKENAEIWAILEEITFKYPILLNRAPTLHRLGVQAFEPILIEGQAIQLHPLVCQAFNADFDGDQMAVHVPLCLEAQLEARILLFSTNNMLSPANGMPIIAPTKDILLGLTYLTIRRNEKKGEKIPLYTNIEEVILSYNNNSINLQDVIILRIIDVKTKNNIVVKTTVGRAILYNVTPTGFEYSSINKTITKKEAVTLLAISHKNFGIDETAEFADRLMRIGFIHATTAGVSINISDLVTPTTKKQTMKIVQKHAEMYALQHNKKFITTKEYTQQIIHLWSIANKKITKEVMYALRENNKRLNPLYLMHKSGARGSITQILQLTGMRGLISKPDGTIFPIPILANFKEGLSILEYFISTHGARKGLVDTALKTANSGYLTRKLVDVSHSLIILEEDCKTNIGLPITTKIYGNRIISVEEQINGRTLIEDLVTKNISIRSPIYCATIGGICALCYGNDLSTNNQVDIGTAVGIIAAQSIGEPGTQLTMRTFHTGGTAIGEFKIDNIKAAVGGIIRYHNTKLVNNINISNNGALDIVNPDTKS